MKVGECVHCGCELMRRINGKPVYPLGNYRSIVFDKEDGSKFEVPICMECHDEFDDSSLAEFSQKLYIFMQQISPENAANYKDLRIKAYFKMGSLKAQDLENGVRIWL